MQRKPSPWILVAVVLLAGQAPAFVHAVSLHDGGLDSHCQFCVHGSGHGASAPPADSGFPALAPAAAGPLPAPATSFSARAGAIPRVRGPPLAA